MWKIFSVPCGSALYKFHCIWNVSYRYGSRLSLTVTQKFQYIESDMVFNAGDIFFEIVIEIQADNSEL
jgi:hypothetical protein